MVKFKNQDIETLLGEVSDIELVQFEVKVETIQGCPGGGNAKPLQYSCLGNPMDRGVR